MKNFFISDIDNITPGKEVHVKGWAQDIRLMKNIAFIIVRDSTGLVQATVKRDCPDFHKLETLSRESVVEITGTVPEKVQSNIGREILVTSVELINMAEVPLPIGITDNVETDMDTRFNSRFLDLRKPEIGRIFQAKSAILWGIRNFLMSQGFTEVQTPKTVSAATEGGAELFHVKYFEKNIFLNQSPQLYKEMLVASGVERVFEVGPAFRAEEHNTPRHLNEFTSIDIEMGFADHHDAMHMLENAIAKGISNFLENVRDASSFSVVKEKPVTPFPRVSYLECIKILKGEGYPAVHGEDLNNEALKIIGKKFDGFYFITDWPTSVRPFYTALLDNNPEYTKSYDLQFREIEITSGAQRVHNPAELKRRIEDKGLDSDDFEFYLRTFKYGMPPHAGWGLGLERLVQVILGLPNIREASLFPRDRNRVFP
ncbi:MAG: aspartate--tRNA(Asn) ligase [Candidatus Thermoplasmatota archaeon]|jgi:aspartyl-tRNA synthetase|nr:aspartate--tRNA(Asn) ligase [Candidatus Thermoplasmatota archaeon]MCL5987776.1 aspartate--tRNA(Asn) ligase [Candidatus Thermoplasmatota archaeon]